MSLFRVEPELLRGFRDGQRDAFETVYRAYVRAVDRYLRAQIRATGHSDIAQSGVIADVIQEVFVRAFSPAGRLGYDGVRLYAPYLTTIARNCLIDALRSRGREVATSPHDLVLILDDTSREPEECFEPRIHAVVLNYLRALAPPLVGVYQQRFVLGRSQEEASSALGLSRATIRTAENHLCRGLRQALARAAISLAELGDKPTKTANDLIAARISSPRCRFSLPVRGCWPPSVRGSATR